MILVCHNCSARLSLDDERIPAHPFRVRCPKCQECVDSQTEDFGKENPRERSTETNSGFGNSPDSPAPPFKTANTSSGSQEGVEHAAPGSRSDMLQSLLTMLERSAAGTPRTGSYGNAEARRALICVERPRRPLIAGILDRDGLEVYIAETAKQAVDRMLLSQIEILLLEPEFDLPGAGQGIIRREINKLRQSERREMFVVEINPDVRTGDQQAAFLGNINYVVNRSDIENLSHVLDRALQEAKELYREFKKALQAK